MKISSETLEKLLSALAKMHAAFPAGEYNFNAMQNIAMNGLTDAITVIKTEVKEFSDECSRQMAVYGKWQIEELVRLGIITRETANKELSSRKELLHAEG